MLRKFLSRDRLAKKQRNRNIEPLERRELLTAAPVINEFMAINQHSITDENGDHSEWIELRNQGDTVANLGGMYLTNDASDLDKWQIPAGVDLAPDGYLVIFASGKNRTTVGQTLHTNFTLNDGGAGSYLALVASNATTIVSNFSNYPVQSADQTYGRLRRSQVSSAVTNNSPLSVLVPDAADNTAIGGTWKNTNFVPGAAGDTGWQNGTAPVGFETLPTPSGFSVELHRSSVAGSITNLANAIALIGGTNRIGSPSLRTDPTLNIKDVGDGGGDAHFADGLPLPGGFQNLDDYAIRATATIFVRPDQAGLWTFGVNSDDGNRLIIDGTTVINDDVQSAPHDALGQRELTAGTHTIEVIYFERGGGAEVELHAAKGNWNLFDTAAFRLVGDAASGGLATGGLDQVIHADITATMSGVNASAYVRMPFNVASPADVSGLKLDVSYDDGYVAYLNGVEIDRRNAPASTSFNSAASANAGLQSVTSIDLASHINALVAGQNVLAFQLLNASAADGETFLAPELHVRALLPEELTTFDEPTPGSANGLLEPVISEFMASNHGTIADVDGDESDWIEIHNPGDLDIELDGYYLTNNQADLTGWRIPNVVLEPGRQLLIFASGKNRSNPNAELHADFTLGANGGYLALVKPDGVTKVSEFTDYGEQREDVSYGYEGTTFSLSLIDVGAQAKTLIPTSDIGTAWRSDLNFNTSTWLNGGSGVGFERSPGDAVNFTNLIQTNVLTQMRPASGSGNTTAYIRIPFQAANVNDLSTMFLDMRYDDGFAAYLNGTLIASANAPSTLAFNSATNGGALHDDGQAVQFQTFDVSSFVSLLQNGDNLLAIQGLDATLTSSDFVIQPRLRAAGATSLTDQVRFFKPPTPEHPNGTGVLGFVGETNIVTPHGFYDAPIQIIINNSSPGLSGVSLWYTTNGATPTNVASATNIQYTGPFLVTGNSVIRARAFKDGYEPSNTATQTYIYLNDVLQQNENPPAGWPAALGGNTISNYGMDPDVVGPNDKFGGLYANTIRDDLKAIPTWSIVTDLPNLFGTTGIYSNPGNEGKAWERPASFELIDPLGGEEGFTIDGGLRIRGGFSRSTDNPKHAFRLFFRNEYGEGKLDYPLFGDEGATEFDKIDLKTAQNYSWAFQNDGGNNTFVREIFSRDLQRDFDQPYTRGKYVHVFINGQYFGLYDIQERAEANYGATYFGGEADEYDTVKAEANPYFTSVTDGNFDAWTRFFCGAQAIASTAMAPTMATECGTVTRPVTQADKYASYMKLQGLNPDGTRNPAYEVQLDPDNLIVYMMAIIYGGNADAPISNFLGNNRVNNWFAVRRRVGDVTATGDVGWKFFAHDNEHTLGVPLGLTADRSGPWTAPDLDQLSQSNPQTIFEYLWAVDEFRVKVGDFVQRAFFNGGELTVQANIDRLQARASQIDKAINGEAARWGDAKQAVGATPYVRTNWLGAVNSVITGFFPQRNPIVIGQFQGDGLFPTVAAPSMNQFGGQIDAGFDVSLSAPAGTVYYTTDGSDPRLVGGGISPTAQSYNTEAHYVATGSTAKYLVPSAAVSGWQNTGFNDSTWTSATTALGFDTGAAETGGGFALKVVDVSAGDINSIAVATDLLDDGVAAGYTVATVTNHFVPYVDLGDQGFLNAPVTLPVPGTSDREQYAVRATTTVTIPAGTYSIAVASDDGFKLTLPAGVSFSARGNADAGTAANVLQFGAPRGSAQTVGQFTLAAPVTGTLTLDYYEEGGGDSVELSILNSGTTTWSGTFQTLQDGTFGWGIQTALPSTSFTSAITTNIGAQMSNVNPGVFVRIPFNASNTNAIESLLLKMKYDDGFVAYLNGTEVARRNVAAGAPAFNAVASTTHNDSDALTYETIDITAVKNLLVNGANVLAIHALNRAANNPDFIIDAALDGVFAGVPFELTQSTNVKARALSGTTWSALSNATFTVAPPSLRVSEIMYNPANPTSAEQTLGFTDNDDFEFIEVRNTGGQPIDLDGIHFTSGITFEFTSASLDPGDTAVIVKNAAAFTARYGAGHNVVGTYIGSLANEGEELGLASGLDESIQTFTYSDGWYDITDGGGYSLTIINTAANTLTWNDKASWRPSDYSGGSPGTLDIGLAPPQGSLVINEILNNTAAGTGTRIELHNESAVSVNVSGFYLSDDPLNLTKYRLPTLPAIAPGGYLTLNAATMFGSQFQLKPNGGQIILRGADAGGTLIGFNVDETYEPADAEVSQGRFINSVGEKDFVAMASNTFGAANSAPKVGPIIINELSYNPLFGSDEFVELYNNSASPVNLQNWSFGAGITYVFGNVTLNPGQYLVVSSIDPTTFRTKYSVPAGAQVVGPYAGVFSNSGEDVRLVKPGPLGSSVLVDRVEYDDELPWPLRPDGTGSTLGRLTPTSYGNDPNNWSSGGINGSPGSVNTSFDETPPSVPSGLVATTQAGPQVTLTWTPSVDLQSGVANYKIFRNNTLVGTSPTASFVDSTVNATTTYSYRVLAVNTSGIESALSTAVSVRILVIASADPVNATTVRVTFSDTVTAATAQNIANYTIGGITVSAAVLEASNNSVLLTTSPLTNGQPYRVTVHGIVSVGGIPVINNSQAIFTPGASAGVLGEYFNDVNQTNPKLDPSRLVLTRVDPTINFSWPTGTSPDPLVTTDNFSVRWTGTIQPRYSESYTFSTVSNDGIRVYVNDQLIIDHFVNGLFAANSNPVPLLAGQRYNLRVEFYDNVTAASVALRWTSASQATEIVPADRLTTPYVLETVAPQVTQISVASSQWSPAFLSNLSTVNPAWTNGVTVPLGGVTNVLPWSNLDQVKVKFDSDVNLAAGDLVINGVNVPTYAVAGFSYDYATFTGTWTLNQPINLDRATITAAATVKDLANNSVTGARSGGVRVAVGDVNGDGTVSSADRSANIARQMTNIGHANYLAASDVNGDGFINIADAVILNQHQGETAPAPAPAAAEAIVRRVWGAAIASAETSTAAEPLRAVRRAAAAQAAAVDHAIVPSTDSSNANQSQSVSRTLRARRTPRTVAATDDALASFGR